MQTAYEMPKLDEYRKHYGIDHVVNDYGETRFSSNGNIIFDNWKCASIACNMSHPEKNAMYSVAACDWNGWFDWDLLNQYGAVNGCFYCNTEDEIISACEVIRNL